MKHTITKSLKQSISLLLYTNLETSILHLQGPKTWEENKHKVSVFENQLD
jgi:hypothetical protein